MKPKLKIRLRVVPRMKLKLTGYKAMAAKKAIRVEITKYPPNFDRLIDEIYIGDSSSKELLELSDQIKDFYHSAKGEHQAIYFWID